MQPSRSEMTSVFKAMVACAGLFVLCLATISFAGGEDSQCTVTFTTGVAGTTASPATGTCTWDYGTNVLMQCDVAVFFSPSRTATSADFKVDFAANSDPYPLWLMPGNGQKTTLQDGGIVISGQRVISVLGVTASGTCKFGKTPRRKPW